MFLFLFDRFVDEFYAMKKCTVFLCQKKAVTEAKLLQKLEHKNIVQHKASFTKNKVFYCVMEFTAGGDLFQDIYNKEAGCTWDRVFFLDNKTKQKREMQNIMQIHKRSTQFKLYFLQ